MKSSVGFVPASEQIDAKINRLGGWRGKTLAADALRQLLRPQEPSIGETWSILLTVSTLRGGTHE